MDEKELICKMEHVKKAYEDKVVLEDFNLTIEKGDFLCITGPSGSGKSTILNLIGMFEKPDAGELSLFGNQQPKMQSRQGRQLMREKILYLFQNFALVDEKSIEYNLEIPLLYSALNKKEKRKAKIAALEQVGLELPLQKKIYQLSGGEQQRVAIARGFLREFELVLADEPTGSLDAENRELVMGILKQFHAQGKTVVIVSHDEAVINSGCKVVRIGKGA